MNFKDYINGFEGRYTEDELWTMKWMFDVGARKAQPIGTIVEDDALITGCDYEHVFSGDIFRCDGDGLLTKAKDIGKDNIVKWSTKQAGPFMRIR